MTSRAAIVVIGAGPAGIATALGLGDAAACVVLERRAAVGGLCGSIEIDGAVFDLGGHAFTTPHPEVRDLVFGALPMVEQRREARCWVDGTLIEYPFQRHFRALPDTRVVADCARGLAEAAAPAGDVGANDDASARHAEDFATYLRTRFGSGIARHFLAPYNEKLWGRDLHRLATGWVRERVASASDDAAPVGDRDGAVAPRSAGEERRAAQQAARAEGATPRTPLVEDTLVAYPARGGYVEIVRALAARVRDVRVAAEVVRVDLARRQVTTGTGTVVAFDHLVSTIAPAELLARVDAVPPRVREAAAALESVSLALVLAVVAGPVATPVQRIYVADPRVLAHKIVLNHASSPSLRGRPCSALTCEIAFSPEKPLPRVDLERRAVEDLVAVGMVTRPGDVLRTRVVTIRDAYPVPTHERAACVRELGTWLEERGVHSVGRLGEWAYVNADECLRRGLALGRALAAATQRPARRAGGDAPAAQPT